MKRSCKSCNFSSLYIFILIVVIFISRMISKPVTKQKALPLRSRKAAAAADFEDNDGFV